MYKEDVLIPRIPKWRWTTDSVWNCQHRICVLREPPRWTHHARTTAHQDYRDHSKSHYLINTNVINLVRHCMQKYDFIIQHRSKPELVWILKDMGYAVGHDMLTKSVCNKVVVLIRVRNLQIVTHMPVWEYGCACV